MWFKGARLLLVGVVAMILFLTTESRSNLTRHPNLLRGSLVNLTRNETLALNIEDKHLYPSNEEPRKTELTQSIKKHVNSLDLKNNDVEIDRSAATISKLHRGHKKSHKHSDHQSMKTHKNKDHVHIVSLSPNLAKKHRDDVYTERPGEDWSCGEDLEKRCCPPVGNMADSGIPAARIPCYCRCAAMPVDEEGENTYKPPDRSSYDNTDFEFCKLTEQGWAFQALADEKRKNPGRT